MAVTKLDSGLYVDSAFRKAAPPELGPAHGDWTRPIADYTYKSLPGGGLLQFDLSRLTLADYRSMREHYQIHISLAVIAFTMHQLDWRIECEDSKIADALEENMRDVWTRMIRGISQAFWAGYSPMALEYKNDPISGRILVTKFKDLVPEECDVQWAKVDGWAPPGHMPPTRYVFDGIKQVGRTWPIPVENSFWFPVLMEHGNYGGRKLLRPAFPAWFFSQIIHLYSNRYFERFGEPVIVGRAPLDAEVTIGVGNGGQPITRSGKEVMEQIVTNIRNSSAVVLPSDRTSTGRGDLHDFEYTVDYLEGQMRGADFERYLSRLDEEMSLAMFTPVLLFRTADIGSYNLGQAHEKLFFHMMNGLAGDMAEYLDRYVLSRLTDYNFSPNAPRPHFRWRQLGKDRDETLRAIVQATIQQGTLKPDVDELGQAIGLEFHEIQALTATNVGPGAQTPDPNSDRQAADVAGEISARLRSQAAKAWNGDGFPQDFAPKLGFRRKMTLAMAADHGLDEATADARVGEIWDSMEGWLAETAAAAEGPDHFADKVELALMKRV